MSAYCVPIAEPQSVTPEQFEQRRIMGVQRIVKMLEVVSRDVPRKEVIKKIAKNKNGNRVRQLSTGIIFESASAATRACGAKNSTMIFRSCYDGREWRGSGWRRVDRFDKDIPPKCQRRVWKKPIILNGVRYESRTEAAVDFGVGRTTVGQWICRGGRKYHGEIRIESPVRKSA